MFKCVFSGAYGALVWGFSPIRVRAVVPGVVSQASHAASAGGTSTSCRPTSRPARGHLMPDTHVPVWLRCVDEYMKEKKNSLFLLQCR